MLFMYVAKKFAADLIKFLDFYKLLQGHNKKMLMNETNTENITFLLVNIKQFC